MPDSMAVVVVGTVAVVSMVAVAMTSVVTMAMIAVVAMTVICSTELAHAKRLRCGGELQWGRSCADSCSPYH